MVLKLIKLILIINIMTMCSSGYSEDNFIEMASDFLNSVNKKLQNFGTIKPDLCSGCDEKENISSTLVPPNIAGLKKRLNGFPIHSGSKCAKGVRLSLNALFDKNIISGPDAKNYSENILSQWKTANSCYKKSIDTGEPFKNFDIRVLSPKNKSEAGHIELFFEGTWYSDFKQRISLWNGGNSKYSKKTFYRFSNCSQAEAWKKIFLKYVINQMISEVFAEDVITDETPFPKKEVLLAQINGWIIKEVFINQGSNYYLFKKDVKKSKLIEVGKDSNSIYSLIYDIKDKKLQIKLAQNALDRWIINEGRVEVQKTILAFEAMTILQRDIYLKAKFKLPVKYSIYPKD